MKLIKDVIVRGSDGKEINKTDVGKARRLLKSGSAKLIQRTPLIIQMINFKTNITKTEDASSLAQGVMIFEHRNYIR